MSNGCGIDTLNGLPAPFFAGCANELLVESSDDLPDPIAGVIALPDNTVVQCCGLVDLGTTPLSLGTDTALKGEVPLLDGFLTNNAGPLVIAQGVSFFSQDISLQNVGGPILDFDGLGAEGFIANSTLFVGSPSVGTVIDATFVGIDGVTARSLDTGFIFDGTIGILDVTNSLFVLPTSATFVALDVLDTATVGLCEITNSIIETTAAGQIALEFRVAATYGRVIVTGVTVSGPGSGLVGINKGDIRFRFLANVGVLDSIVAGQMFFTGNLGGVATVIAVIGTFVRPGNGNPGTHPVFVAAASNERVSVIGATAPTQQLRYDGLETVQLCIRAALSVQSPASVSRGFAVRIRQNGVPIPGAVLEGQTGGNMTAAASIFVQALVTVDTNDLFDFEIANLSSTSDLTISSASFMLGGA